MLNWPSRHPNTSVTDWIVRQLNIQPHEHLLEVGCGPGRLTSAVAAALRNNFLAVVEPSIVKYRQAARRNASAIRKDSVQLHLGEIYDLPYPAAYFHTIFGFGSYHGWHNFLTECLRLSHLVRDGGRLILVSQPGHYRKDDDLRTEAARLQAACLHAGLTDIHTEFRTFPSGECLAITALKPLWRGAIDMGAGAAAMNVGAGAVATDMDARALATDVGAAAADVSSRGSKMIINQIPF